MSTTERKWGKVEVLPDGHRHFYTDEKYKVAIADDSGHEPQDCTDGILWYDFERPLAIGITMGREHFSIPLKTDDGEETRTPSNAATLLALSVEFKWPVIYKTNVYQIMEV